MNTYTKKTPLIKLGTRGSRLALAQAEEFKQYLVETIDIFREPGAIETVVIHTTGDKILDRPLSEVGGKGLFMKDIEKALVAGHIDAAVHSMKDVETFLNPKTNKPFTETELFRFTETPPDGFIDFVTDSTVKNSEMIRKKLAEDGFTHIPYVNDFEAKGEISMIMLIDRPKGSKAVLKGKFGKNDPRERTNPDIMKEDGGVISLKDKAVNMNRGPQGIEPFIKFMV